MRRNLIVLVAFALAASGAVGSAAALQAPQAPPDAAADPAAALIYGGDYVTSGPVVTIAVGDDGRLTARVGDSSALPMRQVKQDEFHVEQADARVVFGWENGRVTNVTVHHRGRVLEGRRGAAGR